MNNAAYYIGYCALGWVIGGLGPAETVAAFLAVMLTIWCEPTSERTEP